MSGSAPRPPVLANPAPGTRALAEALHSHSTLGQLLARVHASREAWARIAATLPAGASQGVQPGPWDEGQWTLLAPNTAVAAKLRHCLPLVLVGLQAQGHGEMTVRVQVLKPR
jgi:hypothetical protein